MRPTIEYLFKLSVHCFACLQAKCDSAAMSGCLLPTPCLRSSDKTIHPFFSDVGPPFLFMHLFICGLSFQRACGDVLKMKVLRLVDDVLKELQLEVPCALLS